MPWKTIDFHGIAHLDRALVDYFSHYLDRKEAAVGLGILSIIRAAIDGSPGPLALPVPKVPISLSEFIEASARRVKEARLSSEGVGDKIDLLLWDYVEVLESAVTELFEQLAQVPLEKWDKEIYDVMEEMKTLLMLHIDDTAWAINRLDEMFEQSKWPWAFLWRKRRPLLTNLEKSRKFLTFHYKKFSSLYREYLKLKMIVEQAAQKFAGYHVFNRGESGERERFKDIYQLLKIWGLNLKSQAVPKELLNRSINQAFGFQEAYARFKSYAHQLENSLYERSRIFKQLPKDVLSSGVDVQLDLIDGFYAEIHALWRTIARYREFLLRTDPNPYIRSRLGFSEWTVAPEPKKTKQLLQLEFMLESLETKALQLKRALQEGPVHAPQVRDVREDVYARIHEMSQPLISQGMMHVNADAIIEAIRSLNELGSFDHKTVDFVGDVLTKALRADWKYHVLFDQPLFEQVYHCHCKIVGPLLDKGYISRMQKFEHHVGELLVWAKSKTLNKHAHEIEEDMNDIKQGLQEFYASVQRGLPAKSAAQALLEYRFLFGKFFHELRENDPDQRSIRNRFLFVDQYFESVEGALKS